MALTTVFSMSFFIIEVVVGKWLNLRMVYHPEYDEDIAVGSKEGNIVGLTKVFNLWAIDLTDHTPRREQT